MGSGSVGSAPPAFILSPQNINNPNFIGYYRPCAPVGTRTNTDNKALEVTAALKPETHLKPKLRD